MEAVPRLPMLSFDLKVSPERTSFGPKLKQYIKSFYNEDPEMYSNEIHSLEGLRASAVCAVRDVTGCSTLKRYYCQLHFLQSRFPMHKDGVAAVPFTWRDTYASMVCTLADIRFEMVAILYNIGALHSQLGASDTRTTSDGMKMSCTHFQCAAWAFQHLKDSFPQPAGVDLAPDVMQFMYHLSLAQAQECILEKSMMDNRKATIIAKVAAQIVDYYNLALNTLEQGGSDDCTVSETVGSKIYKTWKRYVKFKTAYHSCVALLYQGQQAEEQQKMGERVAYYQVASEKLEEAAKLSKGMDHSEVINEALIFTSDVVEGKKKAAKNENEFIYHEEVPDKDTLPDVKGASLVKGIPFNVNDTEISGPDIFARLVPMKAHEASSLYSEEKAKLLRRIGTEIDEKDEELVSFMTSLQLEHLNIHNESNKLPQELVDRCAAISAKPDAIQNLIDSMNKLSDTYHDVEAMLQEIKELLQEEEIREKEYQEVVGKRPPSIVATDLTREAGKYQEAHGKASESNQTLHKAMLLHVSNLRVLAQPLSELQKSIPEVAPPASPEDESAIEELRRLVAKVEEMRRQRAMLSSQLRESICQDDITRQLVTRANEPLDTIFNQELQKHQRYVSLVEQNLAAQENILHALTDAYAKYGTTRKATNEIVRKRESTISALIASYDAYEDLLAKSSKGLEFYRKLEVNVSKLLQRVRSACKVQEEEREQVLAKTMTAAASTITPLASGSTTLPGSASSNISKDNSILEPNTAPKLRDYLQNMKRGAAAVGGYGSGATSSAGHDMSSYYPTYAPAALGSTIPSISASTSSSSVNAMPSGTNPPVFYDQVSTSTSQSQWSLPPVRPAPVGSEGPDISQAEPALAKTSTLPSSAVADSGKAGPQQQSELTAVPSNTYPPGYLAGAAYGTTSSPYPAQPQYKPITGSTFQQYSSYPAGYNQGSYPSPSSATSVYMYTGSYQNQDVGPHSSQVSYASTGAVSTATSATGSYHAPQAVGLYTGVASNAAQPTYQISPVVTSGYQTPTSSHISHSGDTQNHLSSSKAHRSTFDKLFAPQSPSQLPTSQQYQPTVSGTANNSALPHSSMWHQQHYAASHSAYSQYQQYIAQSHGQPSQILQTQPTQSTNLQQTQQNLMSQTQPAQQTQQTPQAQPAQPAQLAQPVQTVQPIQPTQPAHLQQNQQSLMAQTQQIQPTNFPQNQQGLMPHQTQSTNLQQAQQTLMSQQYIQQQQQALSQYSQLQQTQLQSQQYPQQTPQQYQQISQQYPQLMQQYPQQQYSQQQQQLSYSQQQQQQLQNISNAPRHVQFSERPTQDANVGVAPQDSKILKSTDSQLSRVDSSQSQTSVQYGALPAPGGAGDQSWGQQQPPSAYTPASAYSAYPYVAVSASSCYTNAGRYPTSQTSSTQTGVEGQTFAAQYNTNGVSTSYPNNVQGQSRSYYSTPYGYQSPDSPAQQIPPNPLDPQNMTYMQASGNKQTTTTTYMYPSHSGQNTGSHSFYPPVEGPDVNQVPIPSANAAPSPAASAPPSGTAIAVDTPSSSKTSNIDLLAGLDFSLNQAPLTPQQISSKNEETVTVASTACLSPVSSTATTVVASAASVTNAISAVNVNAEAPAEAKVKSNSSGNVAVKSNTSDSSLQSEAEESLKSSENRQSKVSGKDPYSDSEVLNQFVQEVEKYEKFVEGLTSKTLNGPTPLDIKWKELLDLQEKDAHKRSISVARCYPMKNRFPDILPYDNSRVELPSTKDDYINASFVKGIDSLTPSFILTQAPLQSTVNDFWTMVMEQQVEVVVCLLSDAELSGQIYWPVEKSQEMMSGKLRLTLQSCNTRAHWVERILSVTCSDTRATRVIVHLQFTGWPGSSFPPSPGPFLALVLEVLSLHKQQRVASHPIVVHCLSGVGRSGLLCVLAAALLEVQAGRGLVELVPVAASISSQRKNCLRDRQHLQFAYQALLYHAQDLLMKRGILTTRSTFEDKRNRGSKCHTRHPSEDFLLGAPADLSQLQSGLDSMGLGANQMDSNEGSAELTEKPPAPSSKEPTNEPDPLSQLDPLWTLKII